jgi:Protein of unknown function (DUF3568)
MLLGPEKKVRFQATGTPIALVRRTGFAIVGPHGRGMDRVRRLGKLMRPVRPFPGEELMAGKSQKAINRIGTVLIGLLLLTNTGCLAGIILGAGAAAAGGAAAGYYWVQGRMYRDYPSDFTQSHAAVQAAMAENHLPLLSQEHPSAGAEVLETRTTDGSSVKIYLTTGASPLPAEGAVTRIAVRVGVFGEENVSKRVLDQIGKHLAPPLVPPPQPGAVLEGPVQPATATGFQPVTGPTKVPETAAPPLVPVPVQGQPSRGQ